MVLARESLLRCTIWHNGLPHVGVVIRPGDEAITVLVPFGHATVNLTVAGTFRKRTRQELQSDIELRIPN